MRYLINIALVSVMLMKCCSLTDKEETISNRMDILSQNDAEKLVGQKLKNIDQVISTNDSLINYKLIYYLSLYDCKSCVQKGFNQLNMIEQTKKWQIFLICSEQGGIGEIRKNYDIFNQQIWPDEDLLLNEQLNFTATPVFILLDEHSKILSTYHPDSEYDKKSTKFKSFIDLYLPDHL